MLPLISNNGVVECPHKTPSLTPLDLDKTSNYGAFKVLTKPLKKKKSLVQMT